MDLKIYAKTIEEKAKEQIYKFANQEEFKDCKIRIMPDVHAGKGCVVGFTALMKDIAVPDLVGVDIGCGMLTTYLGKIDIDYEKLDNYIRENIPCGCNVREKPADEELANSVLRSLKCRSYIENKERIIKSLGTLGGGNHFIEIDEDEYGGKYLVIHSGSRNLGVQVANYYQEIAVASTLNQSKSLMQKKYEENKYNMINRFKGIGLEKNLQDIIVMLKEDQTEKDKICYLKGKNFEDYIHDMILCQNFASANRFSIKKDILSQINGAGTYCFETVHNYISSDYIVRKGAIKADKGRIVLIPMNMRDGSIIGIGLGNEDWNCSAPHGAGRLMSRIKAKENIDIEEFKNSMNGVYSSTVNEFTLDEAPQAYKPMEEIVEQISDTVKILKVIKPVYNFKAFC